MQKQHIYSPLYKGYQIIPATIMYHNPDDSYWIVRETRIRPFEVNCCEMTNARQGNNKKLARSWPKCTSNVRPEGPRDPLSGPTKGSGRVGGRQSVRGRGIQRGCKAWTTCWDPSSLSTLHSQILEYFGARFARTVVPLPSVIVHSLGEVNP